MMLRLRTAVVLSVAALALSACSGGDDGDSGDPTPSASASASKTPVDGTEAETDAFALVLPEGWKQQDNSDALFLALSDEVIDDFTTNVNVVEDPTIAQVPAGQLEDALETAVKNLDTKDVTPLGEFDVAGDTGARITHKLTVKSVEVQSDQIAVAHDDKGYVITFSFATSTKQADRDKTVKKVMDTWSWKD